MPTVTLENGTKLTLPDGATDDQIEDAVNDYVASQQAQPAAQSPLNQEQLDRILPIKEAQPAVNPYTGQNLGVQPIQQGVVDANNTKNQAIRNNPSMMEKIAEADKQGWLEGIVRGAGNTINELGAGIEDLADKHLPSAISDILAYRPFGENGLTPEQRIARRQGEMETANEDQLVRTLANPIATTVGSALPYFGTGRGLELGIDAIAKAASPITKSLIQNTLTTAGRLEGRSGALGTVGEKASTMASRMDSAPKIPSDFQKRLQYGIKAPLIGAAEGGANYNQSAGEGAAMSALGTAAATFGPLRMLDRVENVRDPYTKTLIKNMDKEGFALTPGVRTGNRQMQTEEAGIKNSDVLGDYYHQSITRPNQRKMTEMAGDAIGLNGKNRDSFSPEELQGHMDALSARYKELESTTNGVITATQSKKMGDALKELQPTSTRNTSAADKARYEQVKSVIQQIRAETSPISRPGQPTVYGFDGAKYQQLRTRIQDEASQAFMKGDSRLGNQLKKVQEALDDSLQAGMGKGKASEWKDLNERYAMTNLLARKGLTPTGVVDPTKITSAVMNGDEALRTLTSRGGRIKNFQKIAKYNDVLDNVEGGSLTGLGKADMTANRDIGKLPFRYKLPLYARAAGRYRLGQIPTWGLGPTASLQTGRAIMQTEPADKAYEGAKMGVEELLQMLRSDQ